MDHQREGVLKADKLEPGDLIFCDQYKSSLPGRVFGHQGASISLQKNCGGTLFYDAATGKMQVVHQVSLNAQETAATKLTWEKEAMQVGVNIKKH